MNSGRSVEVRIISHRTARLGFNWPKCDRNCGENQHRTEHSIGRAAPEDVESRPTSPRDGVMTRCPMGFCPSVRECLSLRIAKEALCR